MKKIDEKNYIERYCSGCGLCHALYNKVLLKDEKGFPKVRISDDKEKIRKICPVFYYEGDNRYGIWGKIEKAIVGFSANKQIRFKAASGGAITEICTFLLITGKVDGIIHTTYDPQDTTKTISVVSYSVEDLVNRCGSRYSISSPLYELKDLIKQGEKYAFVGKPCDVMALRRGQEHGEYLLNQIVVLISFFCAGEPSEKAQDNLLCALGTERGKIRLITYRGNGWPGATTVEEKSGKTLTMEYRIAWGNYLGRDIRELCHYCMDGTGELADIVCADFWHLNDNKFPDFSEHDGRNIIIGRTEIGAEIIQEVLESGRLMMEEDFTNKIETEFMYYQPAQFRRKGMMRTLLCVLKIFGKNVPNYSNSFLSSYSKYIDFAEKSKYAIGTIKRLLRGRI